MVQALVTVGERRGRSGYWGQDCARGESQMEGAWPRATRLATLGPLTPALGEGEVEIGSWQSRANWKWRRKDLKVVG